MSLEKPALIFIHGYRGCPTGMQDIASFFPDYEVFIPNFPPYGESPEEILDQYTPDAFCDLLERYIKKHHIEKPILIGHSMGSVIASAMAAKHPDLVADKIVLLSPIVKKPNAFFRSLSPLTLVVPNGLASHIATGYMLVTHDRKMLKDVTRITYDGIKHVTSRHDVVGVNKFSTSYSIKDFPNPKKKLLLAGKHDRMIAPRNISKYGAEIQAQTEFVSGAGHLINYEKPKEAAKIIRDFIEGD